MKLRGKRNQPAADVSGCANSRVWVLKTTTVGSVPVTFDGSDLAMTDAEPGRGSKRPCLDDVRVADLLQNVVDKENIPTALRAAAKREMLKIFGEAENIHSGKGPRGETSCKHIRA